MSPSSCRSQKLPLLRNHFPFISPGSGPSMAKKIRVLRLPILEREPCFAAMKVASLRRMWIRCGEAEAFEFCSSSSLLRRGSSLRQSAMPRRRVSLTLCTSSTSVVHLHVICAYVMFFYPLATLLIPTSPYSIEQYDMRD